MIKRSHEIWHTCILISQCYKYTTKKPWSRLKIRWKWNKSRNLWKPCKIWNCEYYARFCWVQSKKRFVDLWKRDLYPYPWGLLPNVEALMSHVKREGKWEVGGEGRMLISFQVRSLEKFTPHVNERGTSNLSSCIKVFREIMRFSRV